ncbi:MAG TPA: hypothetical protein VN845_02965 [Solirubrobacteraceae bacterium]|nr:hypothetical protein [Solirubrobacteraceae bacterium]
MEPTPAKNGGLAAYRVPAIARRVWRHIRLIEARAFDTWNRRVDRRVSLTIGSALLVCGAGMATVHVHVRHDFYDVVAQMLPVLMLVGAVNGRYFRDLDARETFDRFLLRGFWVGGLVGEVAALVFVARGHDSILLRGSVIYGLFLCGIIANVYALQGPARAHPRSPETSAGSAESRVTGSS